MTSLSLSFTFQVQISGVYEVALIWNQDVFSLSNFFFSSNSHLLELRQGNLKC